MAGDGSAQPLRRLVLAQRVLPLAWWGQPLLSSPLLCVGDTQDFQPQLQETWVRFALCLPGRSGAPLPMPTWAQPLGLSQLLQPPPLPPALPLAMRISGQHQCFAPWLMQSRSCSLGGLSCLWTLQLLGPSWQSCWRCTKPAPNSVPCCCLPDPFSFPPHHCPTAAGRGSELLAGVWQQMVGLCHQCWVGISLGSAGGSPCPIPLCLSPSHPTPPAAAGSFPREQLDPGAVGADGAETFPYPLAACCRILPGTEESSSCCSRG